jgi:hypothetical protein
MSHPFFSFASPECLPPLKKFRSAVGSQIGRPFKSFEQCAPRTQRNRILAFTQFFRENITKIIQEGFQRFGNEGLFSTTISIDLTMESGSICHFLIEKRGIENIIQHPAFEKITEKYEDSILQGLVHVSTRDFVSTYSLQSILSVSQSPVKAYAVQKKKKEILQEMKERIQIYSLQDGVDAAYLNFIALLDIVVPSFD